jgi:hypothetical protein
MQKIRYSFLFVIGLALIFGTASAAFSQKLKKNEGFLRVTSSPDSYPVRIDDERSGKVVTGNSGVGRGTDFRLPAGNYTVTVEGPDGQVFRKPVTIEKRERLCICLTVKKDIITRPCPYNIVVNGPDSVLEGDKIVFFATNKFKGDTIPVNYKWSVSGGTIVSGLGTDSITVDTAGMGGQTIRAFLDVTDDVYGSTCFQKNEVPTYVEKIKPPEPIFCDMWESKSADDDKARFDNCNLIYRQTPNSQIYIILYQGTEKRSISVDKLAKRASDYFRNLGVAPGQITLVRGGNRARTSAHVWIVPPGAQPPVPQ